MLDILHKRACLSAQRTALEDGLTGRSLTYRALDERAGQAASVLRDLGVRPGERVAILCRNRIAFFELLFGCARLGAILVPMNWRAPVPELLPLLHDCTPVLIAHGAEDRACAQALSAQAGLARLDLDDAGPSGYEARMADAAVTPVRAEWPDDDVWYLLYTSGTTGEPKAVQQTYAMALYNYVNTRSATDMREADRTLNFLPLFHTAGINLFTLPTLFAGGQVIVLPGFDVEAVIAMIEAGRLDTFFAVPAVYRTISLHPRFAAIDFTRVRVMGCGGAPLSDDLVRAYAAHGALVRNGYGMTETGPTCLFMDEGSVLSRIGTAGRPQMLVDVRITRPDGTAAPAGQSGEIQVRGPAVTPGYWNRPEETGRSLAPGGWLRTGDIGCMDTDGYVTIVGRIKDMYISGGENVYPGEVERVLEAHADVLEAAVIGMPDAQWGEVGKAFILPASAGGPDAAALAEHCRAHLAEFKVPRQFVIMTRDFPRTAAGKVRKHLLRDGRV